MFWNFGGLRRFRFGKAGLAEAIELAATNKLIEIELVHVITYPNLLMRVPDVTYTEIKQLVVEHGRNIIQEAEEKILSGIANKWRTALLEGDTAELIVDHAIKHNSDLIVMGSRGLSTMKEFFLGSVSHNVVQHSPIPVCVVK